VLVELTDPNALPFDAGSYYFVPMHKVPAAAAEVALTRPVVHSMVESGRPWIAEGLTAFAQALVREHQGGRRAAIAYLGQFSPALLVAEAQSHSPVTAGASNATQLPGIGLQPLITTSDEVFFRTKAAYVWWMLRDMVGDRVLQGALARYRASEDRDSAYMQRLIEGQLPAKLDLETFFDDWVYRDHGLPELKVDSAYMRKTLGEQTVTAVTIENLGEAWCEVPVAVRSGHGEANVRVVVPAKGKAVVRVPFESAPTEAEVNDGSVPEAERRDNVVPVTSSAR
jgi:aminopeptidase N